jgi:hypothetical protein
MKLAWNISALPRVALLALAALAATASAEQSSQPAYPYQSPGPGPGEEPWASGEDAGAEPPVPAQGSAPGQDYCFSLSTPQTTTSICTVGFGGCERQRKAAADDGQQTTDCVPWSPVACFQLSADPSPAARFCAANLEDCELWRKIDQQKHGKTGEACAWKQ